MDATLVMLILLSFAVGYKLSFIILSSLFPCPS